MVLAEEIKALIRDRYPALIWVNCAEWEVLCSSLAFGQHIEKGGFPAVDRVRSVSAAESNICSCTHTTNVISTTTITRTYPTLGNPTIPIFREVPNRPINGGGFGASPFLGGICESYKKLYNITTCQKYFPKAKAGLICHLSPAKS